jgi:lipid A oxidase
MRVLSAGAWTAIEPRAIGVRRRARLADVFMSSFAICALAAVMVPVTIPQATEGAPGERASPVQGPSTGLGRTDLTFAGYSGVPYTYPSDVVFKKSGLHDFTVHDVPWDGRPFKNPIYYGARIVGYGGGGRIGAMLDFTHSKALARLDEEAAFTGTLGGQPAPERVTLREVFKKLEASHGHNMLTLNGLLRLPSFGFKLQPYAGLGAGVSLPHSEIGFANAGQRTYEYQMAGPVGQALLGIEVRTARMTYFLEYKFTVAPYWMPLSERDGSWLPLDLWKQFQDWMSGEEPPGGYASTTYVSHQGIFGLGVRLTPAPAAP